MLKLKKLQIIQLLLLYSFLVTAAWIYFNFERLWGPVRKRPFQCFDESISRPFIEKDVVPPQQLNLLSIYVPIIIMAVVELSLSLCHRRTKTSWFLIGVLKYIIVLSLFLVGLAMERLLKAYGKYKMARLRPNFLTVCEPINNSGLSCHVLDDTITMTEYKCSSDSYPKWAVNSAFRSFPSGHTSLSAYGMLFITCYLQLLCQQLRKSQASVLLIIRIIQISCILSPFFVGASRVFDYRHHVSDVCAGFLLGSTVALTMIWYLKCHLEPINLWLRRVFNYNTTTTEEAINVTCLSSNGLAEKEFPSAVV